MVINGKTPIVVNGRTTRVCGRRFNEALRASPLEPTVFDVNGKRIIPSKGLT